MHRLVYSSRAAVGLDEAELEALLGQSRRQNEAAGITGILVHVRTADPRVSAFLQLLEGPEDAVAATYRRIVADELHDDVDVVSDGPVPARAFPGWSMRLERLEARDLSAVLGSGTVEKLLTSYAG